MPKLSKKVQFQSESSIFKMRKSLRTLNKNRFVLSSNIIPSTPILLNSWKFKICYLFLMLLFALYMLTWNDFGKVDTTRMMVTTDSASVHNMKEKTKSPLISSNNISTMKNASLTKKVRFIKPSTTSCLAERKLLGNITIDAKGTSIPSDYEALTNFHNDIQNGGYYKPKCFHTQKVAIIVPFRNREQHLKIFLYYIHTLLKRQLLEYQIFVVEQMGSEPFNRATLFNIGFVESLKLPNAKANFTCFIFHDVDLIPENDGNIYECERLWPKHLSPYLSTTKYKMPYREYFGGVVAISKNQFKQLNGFTNRFWGWGGEDDDFYNRVQNKRWFIGRNVPSLSRYTMLNHKASVPIYNMTERVTHLRMGKSLFSTTGLNDLKYSLVKVTMQPLLTLIQVKLQFEPISTPAPIQPSKNITFKKYNVRDYVN